jgi:hypothetical protein
MAVEVRSIIAGIFSVKMPRTSRWTNEDLPTDDAPATTTV